MIPGYDLLHRLAGTILAAELGEKASVLVVGAGTGMEIVEWGRSHPGWRFTGVDPSAPMLAQAQEKVEKAGLSGRVTLKAGTLEQLPEDEDFDAAALLLVLHFVPDNGEKADLLCSIAERLKPGAPFLLATRFGDPESTRFKKMLAFSKAWTLAQGMDSEEAEKRFSPARTDLHDVPEERVKILLREAGLIDVQRFYQGFLIGAWLARKPK